MLRLREFRSAAKGLCDLLPYAALLDPGIVLMKDGSLLAAWQIRGEDTESSLDDELEYRSLRFNDGILGLGSGWSLHVDAVRMPERSYPLPAESFFPDRVSLMIEEERRKKFSEGAFYSTRTVLTAVYKPPVVADKLLAIAMDSERNNALEKALKTFSHGISELEVSLSTILHMDRLASYFEEDEFGQRHEFSQLLSFLRFVVTGEEQPMLVPDCPMYLDALIAGQDLVGGLAPRIGDKNIAVLALDGLPQTSWPAMLSVLEALPISYRFSSRFLCLSQFEAQIEVDKYRKTWRQQVFKFFDVLFNKANPRANRDAITMAEDAEQAYADVQSGQVGAGFYTANIVLLNDDLEVLNDNCRQLRQTLMTLGFGCRVEAVNALEAWLGTHPGNWWSNVRRPLLNTLNLADLLPLASIWPGREYNPNPFYPSQSPPLMYCATSGSTHFRLNVHVGDLGHTLIVGPTGAGKSTLLGLIAAQFRRYRDGTAYCFDKGNSMYALAKGMGGLHLDVAGESNSSAFCPLYDLESDSDKSWAADWIATLCQLQKLDVLARHRTAINEGINLLANNPPHMRSISDFYHLVPDREVQNTIKHYTTQGAMGRLLDGKDDTLRLSRFSVFEIEQLMNLGDENLIPVLLYLFRKIEKSLSGQPAMLILDEAWVMLGHPVFRAKIREWLKVLRKANCAVILATQSLSDADRSGIMDVLVESCPTKILLPNPEARNATQIKFYTSLGLNERQIEIISTATKKRDYYVLSPEGRRLVNLALGPVTLAFIGVSDKESIARVKELEGMYGPDKWQDEWLKERGVFLNAA